MARLDMTAKSSGSRADAPRSADNAKVFPGPSGGNTRRRAASGRFAPPELVTRRANISYDDAVRAVEAYLADKK